jgi:hypothetical protein
MRATAVLASSLLACGGATATLPPDADDGGADAAHAVDGGSDAAAVADAADAHSDASASDATRADAGPFVCAKESCDAATQLCDLNTSGGTTIGLCAPLPPNCDHDCACIRMMFQCPVKCTNEGGRVTVVCGP